jgi:tetratricopeptide (TPR) repeat protein
MSLDEKTLQEIDSALNTPTALKKAEILIARSLKNTLSAQERAQLLWRRAQARLLDSRPDDALEDLQTSLALAVNAWPRPQVELLLGDIYFTRYETAPLGFADRKDALTARQHYLNVTQEAPADGACARAYYQLGRIHLSQRETTVASHYFQQALNLPSQPAHLHALCYERLGFIELTENRDPQKALHYFQKARDHVPANIDGHWLSQLFIRMSRAYLALEDYSLALETAQKALHGIQQRGGGARADLPDAHLAIADILAVMEGHEGEAIEHYLRFLQASKRPASLIDVTWSQVHERIGELSFRIGRYTQAIQAFQKALEMNPYHPWDAHLSFQIARCHYRLREYERAVATLEKLLDTAEREAAPITDWRVFNLLGNALFAIEKYARAARAYQHALDLAPVGADLEKTRIYLRFAQELDQTPD